ncbi:glycosyltransferase family 2 protein [Sanguibacter sp. 25GB23B1]|uniref:glycosyltransferase family 2 protein n=1 Tax=unclassified Sanguibacter TaxID=2645534 RepID=UPI0032AEDC8F
MNEQVDDVAAVRIVTVVFHPGEELERFVQSIAAATGRSTHLVVVNNGPMNEILRTVGARPGVSILDAGGNVGYGTAANLGARGAPGEWVVVSNPDIVLTPGSLDRLLAVGASRPSAGSLGPSLLNTDGSLYPSARSVPSVRVGVGHALFGRVWASNPWSSRYQVVPGGTAPTPVGWLSGAFLLMRLDAFRQAGGFDERYFMFFEDLDLGERLGALGWENVYVPDARVVHDQGTSWRHTPVPMIRAHHRSARRYIRSRYSSWYMAPLRWVLVAGLRSREAFAVRQAGRR